MTYSPEFFNQQQSGALLSAKNVVPLVLKFVQPQSVVDVGCGTGPWLKTFLEHGVSDILGLDGHYVPSDLLLIPPQLFQAVDLNRSFQLERKFDLVISLEVAEHLHPAEAPTFIESLTQLGSVILFSAAIPFQGGQDHVNERWPGYWANLFQQFGFVGIDCLRPSLWHNEEVEWWYLQNMFFFVNLNQLHNYPFFAQAYEPNSSLLGVVHPRRYMVLIDQFMYALEQLKKAENRQKELETALHQLGHSQMLKEPTDQLS